MIRVLCVIFAGALSAAGCQVEIGPTGTSRPKPAATPAGLAGEADPGASPSTGGSAATTRPGGQADGQPGGQPSAGASSTTGATAGSLDATVDGPFLPVPKAEVL
ncbi:MAG: hypothetical protein FJZ00_07075 [Candidatus Sericytochromatia bacterium]|uniref:Uncharacterized protein n=1 Tax=Candidatus Tanganyikabacteria bacterium TaxID=2961651 RepID=A0A937X4Z9_9BACT|nr:hypothetical protein [Candidatus Tanganyikabacteria bacterium]